MKMSFARHSQPDQQQPEGAGTGPRGQIKLMAAAQEKEVIVTVRGNGKGMTEEEVSKALEPFYTKSSTEPGLGSQS